jgi:hypothetical protein
MNVKKPSLIRLDPESELARTLAAANDEPVLLESNGVRFRVMRIEDDPWAGYDPDAVMTALREVAGTLSPEEGKRIKELIRHGRDEGTRPIDRP